MSDHSVMRASSSNHTGDSNKSSRQEYMAKLRVIRRKRRIKRRKKRRITLMKTNMNIIDITNKESPPKIPIQTRESDIIDLLTDSDDLEVISDITPKPVLKSNVSRQNIINCDIKQPIGSLNCENTKRLLLSPMSSKSKPQSAVVFNIIIKNEKSNLGISVENTKHEFAPKSTPVQKLIGADTSLNSFQNTFPPQFPPDLFKEPQQYNYKNALKDIPPTPTIQIENKGVKVKLTWNLEVKSSFEKIKNYELYACKETVAIPDSSMWSKLGDIEPLNLPIECELDEFIGGFTYYFALRVVDVHNRCSPFAVVHALL